VERALTKALRHPTSPAVLGATGAGWLVGVTGLAGLLGRLLLAWVADRIALRCYAAAILATQALALVLIAIAPARRSSSR
jgi:hypothetical protein